MPSTFLSGQCRNNTQVIKNVRLSEAKRAGYMWDHLPMTNLSLFLWQTDKYALPQKAVVKPRYPKADRCLYLICVMYRMYLRADSCDPQYYLYRESREYRQSLCSSLLKFTASFTGVPILCCQHIKWLNGLKHT